MDSFSRSHPSNEELLRGLEAAAERERLTCATFLRNVAELVERGVPVPPDAVRMLEQIVDDLTPLSSDVREAIRRELEVDPDQDPNPRD